MAGDGSEPLNRAAEAPLTIDAAALIVKLEAELQGMTSAVLAFDGDGTLWSGDVGEDVFRRATQQGLLRRESQEALLREARRYGVDTLGEIEPNRVAQRLFSAYLAGEYPERDVCAMMTWCYAGITLAELTDFVEVTFAEEALAERLHRELSPVMTFAKQHSLQTLVVSASPQRIVERAAALWNVPAENVIAARPALSGERIEPRLAEPVPYAEHKPLALGARISLTNLLASFGDNVFDIELLGAARVGVAIRPKPRLRSRLHELPGVYLLEHAVG